MDTATSRGGEAGRASGEPVEPGTDGARVEIEVMPDGRTIRFYRAVVSGAGRHDDPHHAHAAEPQ